MSCVNRQEVWVMYFESVFMLNASVRDEIEISSAFKSMVECLKLVVVGISDGDPCIFVAAWNVGRVSCHENNAFRIY